jgi:TetR/AcrR family transcriptional repressor of bet genes
MPLIVDREARRREVARVATRLIAERGLEGASVRAIAAAIGTSTTVVSHYFHNKRELLLFAYREAMIETVAHARRRRDRGGDLAWCIEAILPLDHRRRDNWKIWFAFWGMAIADAEFMSQQQESGRDARELFAELIAATSDRSPDQCQTQARRLLVTVAGLATQATYDPDDWPPERQRAILAAEIASFA